MRKDKEIWVRIETPFKYERSGGWSVSNLGRVRRNRPIRLLKKFWGPEGWRVSISHEREQYQPIIYHLVRKYFTDITQREVLLKTDEFDTRLKNITRKGPTRKLTKKQVRTIKVKLTLGYSLYSIAKEYKVNWMTISNIREGITFKKVRIDSILFEEIKEEIKQKEEKAMADIQEVMTEQEQDSLLIGMTLRQAKGELVKLDMILREMVVDGETLFGTCEYNPNRVNVEIKEGKVVKIFGRN